ncbi:MAG: arabinofuranosidase catalytic domain-containing protein [Flavobacterium sp.]
MSIKKYVFGKNNARVLFLDQQLHTAFYAYSLRRLSANYTGMCIRVRRSSDNEEMDIDFLENKINTAGLISFVGSDDGFVSVWYDQSGNGKNKTQVISLHQPKIVSSGNIILENELPTLSFDLSSFMNQSDTRAIDDVCAFYVVSVKLGTQDYYGVARHIPSNGRGFALYTGYSTGSPNIVPYLNGNAADLAFGTPAEYLPTILTVRAFSMIGSANFTDSIYMRNNHMDGLGRGEGNWGYYDTSGINLGYLGARAIMNLSEYIVFANANRQNLAKLSKKLTAYYNT